jgi:hypothetical protein
LPQVYDVRNDEELRLSDDEVRFLRRLQKNKYEQVGACTGQVTCNVWLEQPMTFDI